MSISAQTSFPSIKPDLRQGNRRSSDIEQQAYAAVGRRFAADGAPYDRGPYDKGRILRVALAGAASITVVMLVTLVALLTYENINTPHARKVASIDQPAPPAAAAAPAAKAKPVVIIDEKDGAPVRQVLAAEPVPPLVLLSPVEHGATPPTAARPAVSIKTAPRLREHARAAGKQIAAKAAKAVPPQPGRKGARNEVRNESQKAAPPAKRKAPLASMAAPAGQGTGGGALGTLLSYASAQRRYLAQPLPALAARPHAPRRRHLSEP